MGVISAGIYESHWLDDLIGPIAFSFSLSLSLSLFFLGVASSSGSEVYRPPTPPPLGYDYDAIKGNVVVFILYYVFVAGAFSRCC